MARDNHDCSSDAGAYVFGVENWIKQRKKKVWKRYSKRYTFSSIKQLILIIIHTLYICCIYVVYMKKFIFILFLIDHFRFYDVNSNRVEKELTKMHSFVNMVLCFVYTTRIYKQSCAFMLEGSVIVSVSKYRHLQGYYM